MREPKTNRIKIKRYDVILHVDTIHSQNLLVIQSYIIT